MRPATGDRVTVRIRPQKGSKRPRHDIDVNNPRIVAELGWKLKGPQS
jgi:hypothetical protein